MIFSKKPPCQRSLFESNSLVKGISDQGSVNFAEESSRTFTYTKSDSRGLSLSLLFGPYDFFFFPTISFIHTDDTDLKGGKHSSHPLQIIADIKLEKFHGVVIPLYCTILYLYHFAIKYFYSINFLLHVMRQHFWPRKAPFGR